MSFERRLKYILDGFGKFLKKRELVETAHVQYFIHWVKEFLYFAKDKTTLSFEQSRDFFIHEIYRLIRLKALSCTYKSSRKSQIRHF